MTWMFNRLLFHTGPEGLERCWWCLLKAGKPPSNPESYRPISMTSIFCRMFERVLKRRTMRHLMERELLDDSQHGFRPRRSTVVQLLLCYHEWARILDDHDNVDAVSLF